MSDIFHNEHRYSDMDAWRAEALALHAVGPIHRIDSDDRFDPLWAVIGHDEIMEIERDPELFTNEPESVLQRIQTIEFRRANGVNVRTLVHMDAPDHTKYRKLTNDWFKPAGLKRMQGRLDELSAEAVETIRVAGGEIDFNTEVAIPYPLQVILAILGLPSPQLAMTRPRRRCQKGCDGSPNTPSNWRCCMRIRRSSPMPSTR